MSSDFILEAKGMWKSFYNIPVIKNVDFYLRKGSIHSLIGENGAGKSTLSKMISGAYTKDEGEIFIEGKRVNISKTEDAYKCGISMIYQEFRGVPALNVSENIFLGRENIYDENFLRLFGYLHNDEMIKETNKIMKLMDITSFSPETLLGGLSRAEQQLVEILKGISLNAKIYIFDEPTASLSKEEVNELFKILQRLQNEGCSIIYISHRLEEVMEISDEITILRNGQVVEYKPTKELTMNLIIKKLLGIEYVKQKNKTIGEDITVLSAGEFRFKNERKKLVKNERISPPLILKNLSREGEFENINFTLQSGEVLGIAGLLGSGRSEIVETIFGLKQPTQGEIIFQGKNLRIASPRQAINLGIALLTENRKEGGLFLTLPLELNILIVDLMKINKFGFIQPYLAREHTKKQIKNLNISPSDGKVLVKYLSGGNQQKVVLAKWLYRDSQVIMLDEPTAGIDIKTKFDICNQIDLLAARGKSIILITSEIEVLLGICDRVLILRKGKLIGEFASDCDKDYKIIHETISAI